MRRPAWQSAKAVRSASVVTVDAGADELTLWPCTTTNCLPAPTPWPLDAGSVQLREAKCAFAASISFGSTAKTSPRIP
jgi:hypothetical protein